MLARALKSIPLGSQTFSKSRIQFPVGIAPLFLKRGRGSKVWDYDGNEYIDFINSLAAVTLGYCDPDVDAAVAEQLKDGVILSLSHQLEMEVAEQIVEMVPCAEMVRFGKNGSDATAGCVRLARAFTGRDRIASCGYHGWQDWFIGATTRNKGIPKCVGELTHRFPYNDIEALRNLFKQHPGEIAAVILEPMNTSLPQADFLGEVKALAHKNGALVIFDETITGFRFANGGAQEYFGITPDLASFGKGIANGFPVSAVTGRADVMREMEEIFFSFTFGGELLSLAAAKATLQKLKREPILKAIADRGASLSTRLKDVISQNGLASYLEISGHPSWTFLNVKAPPNADVWEIKTLILQEFLRKGILAHGTHNLSFAHSEKDIDCLLAAYKPLLALLAHCFETGKTRDFLLAPPIQPVFKIR